MFHVIWKLQHFLSFLFSNLRYDDYSSKNNLLAQFPTNPRARKKLSKTLGFRLVTFIINKKTSQNTPNQSEKCTVVYWPIMTSLSRAFPPLAVVTIFPRLADTGCNFCRLFPPLTPIIRLLQVLITPFFICVCCYYFIIVAVATTITMLENCKLTWTKKCMRFMRGLLALVSTIFRSELILKATAFPA